MTFTPKVWNGVLHRLQEIVPSFSYEAWIEPLEARLEEGRLVLVCPSSFHRERIREHYLSNIQICLDQERDAAEAEAGAEEIQIELGVRARRAKAAPRSDQDGEAATPDQTRSGTARRATAAPGQRAQGRAEWAREGKRPEARLSFAQAERPQNTA